MKRIFVSAAIILLATSVTLANKEDREARREARHEKKEIRREKRAENKSEVSYQTEQEFQIDFPEARNIAYEKMSNFDEVTFTLNGKELRAYYDYESKLVGTTNKEEFSALPVSAQKEINHEYRDYAITEVIRFDDNELNESDMTLFGSSFDDADNYFVQVEKGKKDIVLKVSMSGIVSYFKEIK
jgi:hypothetical protein